MFFIYCSCRSIIYVQYDNLSYCSHLKKEYYHLFVSPVKVAGNIVSLLCDCSTSSQKSIKGKTPSSSRWLQRQMKVHTWC